MTRLVCLVCLCLTLAPVASAQTPTPVTKRANPELFWSGVAIAGMGGAMLGHGLVMQSKSVTCFGGGFAVSCFEEGGNKALWLGLGAGVTAAGWTMSALGGKKVTVTPMRTRTGWRVRAVLQF